MSFFLTKIISPTNINKDEIYNIKYNYLSENKNMKYIVATSDTPYFRWQMLVQINNFKRLGILNNLTYIISVKNKRSVKLNYIIKETGVKVYTYKDERKNNIYSSSIRPHILKKHFTKFPEECKMFFYLDPDVLFKEKPEYDNNKFITSDWWVSDTKSYLDVNYIKSKSNELFKLMCKTVNISSEIVKKMDLGAGGAQYIMKNANVEYWDNVEKDSENLYKLMINTTHKYNPKHPIQAWTADMWAVLWGAWKLGYNTIIDEEMEFSWATGSIKHYEKTNIFHNAGVFDQKNLFNKIEFLEKHPFDSDFSYVSKKHGSIKYVEEIKDTKKNYNNLIKKL